MLLATAFTGLAVINSLAVSAEAKTYVPCLDSHGDTVTRVKPGTCTFHVAGSESARLSLRAGGTVLVAADEVYVKSMRWRHWGWSIARAKGTFVGNMGASEKGTVKLSGRKRCVGYGYVYTRFRMTFSGHTSGAFDFRLDGCA